MAYHYLRKYGQSTVLYFALWDTDGINFYTTASHATGDTKISKDAGAEANTTNGFVDRGTGYSIQLTSTEMQAAVLVVYLADQATKVWLDEVLIVETYGNASAQHFFDFRDPVRGGLTALPNADADEAGGLPISDLGGLDLDALNTNVSAILVDTGTTLDNLVDDLESRLGIPSSLGSGATIADNLIDMAGGPSFVSSTDCLEAIRDRGDAAWTTGAGGTPPQLLQSTTIATLTSQTSFTLTAGSADDDAYNDAIIIVTDSSTSTQKAVGTISDYVGSTLAVTLVEDPGIFTMAVGDTVDIIAALSLTAIESKIDTIDTNVDEILLDTAEIGVAGAGLTNINLPDQTMNITGNLSGSVGSVTGHTPQTGDSFARLGAPSGASISADLVSIGFQNSGIIVTLGTAGDGLTDLGGMSTTMKSQVNAEVLDVMNVDTFGEPGQGVPPATTSIFSKINYLYKSWRNKKDNDGSMTNLYNDAGSTVDQKQTTSESAGTVTKGEWVSGP